MVSVDHFDEDERAALAGLEPELAAVRVRHAGAPDVELLRAARAGLLPRAAQDEASAFLAASRWSRVLVDGLDEVGATLDASDVSRLLARIQRGTRPAPGLRLYLTWPLVATAAAAVVAGVLLIPRNPSPRQIARDQPSRVQPPPAATAVQLPPAYRLVLEKPQVKVSMAALTWRGATEPQPLMSDLKPALDAFRADHYDEAQGQLAALEAKYPSSVEVFFYRGASRLLVGDYPGAIESLTKAARVSDTTFADDIAWYRAVAHERSGSLDSARVDLTRVCRGGGSRAVSACEALEGMK